MVWCNCLNNSMRRHSIRGRHVQTPGPSFIFSLHVMDAARSRHHLQSNIHTFTVASLGAFHQASKASRPLGVFSDQGGTWHKKALLSAVKCTDGFVERPSQWPSLTLSGIRFRKWPGLRQARHSTSLGLQNSQCRRRRIYDHYNRHADQQTNAV